MTTLDKLGTIILASKSPRRKEILDKMNLNFKVIPSNVIENLDKTNPPTFVERCATKKARKVSLQNKQNYVIGADTVVVLNGAVLEKPNDKIESREMLRMLSGQIHDVFSGVSIQNAEKNIKQSFFCKTAVELYHLSDDVIDFYIKNYKPFDKAGSYGIQDWFSSQIKKINGCYYNVMGLPLSKVFKCLYDLSMNNLSKD